MTVALVSSEGQCGIAEHSRALIQHVGAADREIGISINADWLDPQQFPGPTLFDVVHLNYHRGLHSRWTPEVIARYAPTPFVITFHDTYEHQPDDLPWRLLELPNVRGMVVHEPCDLSGDAGPVITDLSVAGEREGIYHPDRKKVHYWRQPVPERPGIVTPYPHVFDGPWRPTLGTLGFDFPWKNYDLLAGVTGQLGWNLRVIGQVTPERQAELRALNPRTHFDGYVDTGYAVAALESCDATAFLYTCANSGTSGAIRLGIAAGRPLVAAWNCRQTRDLQMLDNLNAPEAAPHARHTGIWWAAPTEAGLRTFLLGGVPRLSGPQGYHLPLLVFAEQENWQKAGHRYAQLYQEIR